MYVSNNSAKVSKVLNPHSQVSGMLDHTNMNNMRCYLHTFQGLPDNIIFTAYGK